jgi:DNA replication protein DnaC
VVAFGLQPSINEKLVRELMTGEYLERRENILLVGNSGTGKTHLANALGFAACMQSRNVRFFTVKALVTHLLEMTASTTSSRNPSKSPDNA